MQDTSPEHSTITRPYTSLSKHFSKRHKNPDLTMPLYKNIPLKIFQNLTIKRFTEIDSYIKIRPLTATALSASETNSPKRNRLERLIKSPSKQYTDNFYTQNSSKKVSMRTEFT